MSGAASVEAGAAVAAGTLTTPSTATRAVTPAPSLVFHFMTMRSFGWGSGDFGDGDCLMRGRVPPVGGERDPAASGQRTGRAVQVGSPETAGTETAFQAALVALNSVQLPG
ncbi:hypothetical protein GCM10009565_32640 [Amycolatopsis albidoflavus]